MGLRVAFAADTHLHADFLTGATQLAAAEGARVLAAAAGDRDYPHTALRRGPALAPLDLARVLLGAGTAMVYPTLLAVIGDVAHPAWSASTGSGATADSPPGAILSGITADLWGLRPAVWIVVGRSSLSCNCISQQDGGGVHSAEPYPPHGPTVRGYHRG